MGGEVCPKCGQACGWRPSRPGAARRSRCGLSRFRSLYRETPDGCWEWQGSTRRGYGMIKVQGRTVSAHRYAFELFVGPIPDDKPHLLHSCHNPRCVNPDHLSAGTHAENMQQKAETGRAKATAVRGQKHPKARLTRAQVVDIKRRLRNGESQTSIRRSYNLGKGVVWSIANGRTWTHVDTEE